MQSLAKEEKRRVEVAENRFEIIDDGGVIYSGDKEEICSIFNSIVEGEKEFATNWGGDLKLIEVHAVHK